MNSQEIFDTVATHLLTQGCRSEGKKPDGGIDCLYRGPSGKKCAAGCLISDDRYVPEFEGRSFKEIRSFFPELEDHNLIYSLQTIHDHGHPDDWYDCLVKTGLRYNLNLDALTSFTKQPGQSSE